MTPETPLDKSRDGDDIKVFRTVPEGVILERFKRMQTLPPHVRNLEDEFFVQSYLRRKRYAI